MTENQTPGFAPQYPTATPARTSAPDYALPSASVQQQYAPQNAHTYARQAQPSPLPQTQAHGGPPAPQGYVPPAPPQYPTPTAPYGAQPQFGAPQPPFGLPPAPPAGSPKGKGRTGLIAAVAVVALAGAGVGAYFAFSGDDDKKATVAQQTQQNQVPLPPSTSPSDDAAFPTQQPTGEPTAVPTDEPSMPTQMAGGSCGLPAGVTEEPAEIADEFSLLATSLTTSFSPTTVTVSFSADSDGRVVHSLCWDDISQAQLDELGESLLSTWQVDQVQGQQVYLVAPDDTIQPGVVAVTVTGDLSLETGASADGSGSVEIDYF